MSMTPRPRPFSPNTAREFLDQRNLPGSTLLAVPALALKEFLVEIEVVAAIP